MLLMLSISGALVHGAIYLLEAIFALGVIGSAAVVLLAGIEDLREVFEKDEQPTVSRAPEAVLRPITHS